MPVRRIGGLTAVAAFLALASLPSLEGPADLSTVEPVAAATNHAAIVVDTGREVKRFCLAFPEDEISGAEALRRVDSQVVFASYGSRGEAVCALCGTGCPSSDCFCDPQRFWAYHRAGPGGEPYRFSRAGASATVVRDGDVEGWKWGSGEAPPAATVGEVCDVPEPPARSAAATTTAPPPPSSSTTAPPEEPNAGGAPAGEEPRGPAPSGGAPSAGPGVPAPTGTVAPGGAAPADAIAGGAPAPAPDAAPEVAAVEVAPEVQAAPVPLGEPGADPAAVAERDGSEAASGPAAAGRPAPAPFGGALAGALFVTLLAGILVWRGRLRTAGVRRRGRLR